MNALQRSSVFLPAAVDGVPFGFALFDVWDVQPPPEPMASARRVGPPGYIGVAAAGGIATLVDARAAFGRPAAFAADGRMAVFTAVDGELYGLIVDAVAPCVSAIGLADGDAFPDWAMRIGTGAVASPIGPLLTLDPAALFKVAPHAPDRKNPRRRRLSTP
ncbi:MAG: hypothetical protein AAF684_08940 [Pseudomonadota bacterium]